MNVHRDQTWTRRGSSLLWDVDALAGVAKPAGVVSLRQLFLLARHWPADLPGTTGGAVVVAGLEGRLDALGSEDAETWLENDLK